jgi:GAF domain-containing protein/HAMP domain-containing protein
MIDRFLRRLPVRRRIVGAFLILVALLALSLPLIVTNQGFLLGRLQQITDVEARADRLLLLASTRLESSRVNVMRYVQDYAPSAYEALDDADQAAGLMEEARDLIASLEQKEAIGTILDALDDYKGLVADVEAARSQGREQEVSPILFQAYRLGNDIGQRIEQIVGDSEARVASANEAIRAEAQVRLILLVSGYGATVILALILAALIQRSITRPVAELRRGAEAFSQGQVDHAIPVVGRDELSLLASIFNQMAAQVRDLIGTLEQRVADRTRELERRTRYLEATSEVASAATSVLDVQELLSRVVSLLSEQFGFYHSGIFLLDPEGEWAILQAASSEGGRRMLDRGHRLRVGEMGIVGYVTGSAEPRIALDVGEDAVFFDNPDLPETRSEMALPLRARGEILGALDVQSREPAAFSDEDVAVLQTLADQIAIAISNARLFQQAQESLEAERRAYGELSREAWRDMLLAQPKLGFLRDRRGIVPAQDLWRPEMETAVRSGRTAVGGDDGTLAVPIRAGDRVIGVIDARKPDGSGEWSTEEVALVETLTEQLSMALEGARLYQDTQRREARERLVGQVATSMRETLDVDAVLQTAVSQMRQALGIAEVEVRIGSGPRRGPEMDSNESRGRRQPEGGEVIT